MIMKLRWMVCIAFVAVLGLVMVGTAMAGCSESCAVPKNSDQCSQCCPDGSCAWCCGIFASALKNAKCGAYCFAEGKSLA